MPGPPRDADKLDVFISYSREDLDFADQLDVTLGLAGFAPTLDRHGIHGAENWQEKLTSLIRDSDTVVFVLTPASAASDVCDWEVRQAVTLGKRIIPVVSRPLGEALPPPALAALNYIFFYAEPKKPGSGYRAGVAELVEALKIDHAWLREHTRLLQRAIEWDAGGRQSGRLLSGADIAEAKAWAARRPKDAPAPTETHLAFIRASEDWESERQSEERRRLADRERLVREAEAAQQERDAAVRRVVSRTRLGAALAILLAVLAGGFGVYALQQKREADARGREALAEKSKADVERMRAQAEAARAEGERKRAEAEAANAKAALQTATRSLQLFAKVPARLSAPAADRDAIVRELMIDARSLIDGLQPGGSDRDFEQALVNVFGGFTTDPAENFMANLALANRGNFTAMEKVGSHYLSGSGIAQSHNEAREWYEKAAAGGNAVAMRQLGILHMNGWGVGRDHVRAREWYEKAVAAGNAAAMHNLGALYQNGRGVPRDLAEARRWYERGAAAGEAPAMTSLGLLHANGDGVPRDPAKAHELYLKAAALDDARATGLLGAQYEHGRGVTRDLAAAREWYAKAAAKGEPWSMSRMGDLYYFGRGVEVDFAKAREWYEKAAAKNYGWAMTSVGLLYERGEGVAQDHAAARGWFLKAAARGESRAMAYLGVQLATGRGVPRDRAKAVEWYEKAAAAGDTWGMRLLGEAFVLGRGIGRDFPRGQGWYEKAAARGDVRAMSALGGFFATGRYVAQDHAKAREWYEKAATAGDAGAMRQLGLLHENGQGGPQDVVQAREWYEKAAAASDTAAMQAVAHMYRHGRGVARDEALAQAWLERARAGGSIAAGYLLIDPTYTEKRAAIAAAEKDGRHYDAMLLREQILTTVEIAEIREEGKPGRRLAGELGDLSWRAVLAREHDRAISAATRALELEPGLLWVEINRSHALMFLGRVDDARALYLKHKDKVLPVGGGTVWQDGVAQDFAKLRNAGMSHTLMSEIEPALGIDGRKPDEAAR